MKVSCTHFQCAAGAFAYLREHFPHTYSVDMSRQILTLNVNLMLVRRCLVGTELNPGRGLRAGPSSGPAEGSAGPRLWSDTGKQGWRLEERVWRGIPVACLLEGQGLG